MLGGGGILRPSPRGGVILYPLSLRGFSGGLLASLNGCGLAHKGVALQARQRWVCIHRAASWPQIQRLEARSAACGRQGVAVALPAGAVLRDWQSLMDAPSGGPALLAVEGQGAGAAPRFDVFRNDGNMPLFQISLLVGGLREFKILERGLGDTPKKVKTGWNIQS